MDTFDVEAFARDMGGSVSDVTNGIATIKHKDETGNDVESEFRVFDALKDMGMDPAKTEIQYNSPASALDSNALSFASKIKLALAEDPKSKQKFLEEEYGSSNVKMQGDEFLVKDDGMWKKADSSFLAQVAGSAPEIAGGIIGRAGGAAAGAALGSAVPVIGTGVGAVAGAMIGSAGVSALAKVIKDKGAEVAGLKTEYDVETAKEVFGKEMAVNLAIDSVLGAAGFVYKVGKPLVKSAAKNSAVVGKGLIQKNVAALDEEGKAMLVEALPKLAPGTSKADWQTITNSVDDAKGFTNYLNKIVDFTKSGKDGVDPVTKKMVGLAEKSLTAAQSRAQKLFDTGMKEIEASGVLNKTAVNAKEIRSGLLSDLQQAGVLTAKDGKFMVSTKGQVTSVTDKQSLQSLNDLLNNAMNLPEKASVADVQRLLRGVQDTLHKAGVYKSDASITNSAGRIMSKFASTVDSSITKSMTEAGFAAQAQKRLAINKQYSSFQNLYKDFQGRNQLGGSDQQVLTFTQRLLGDKGEFLEQDFRKMFDTVGATEAGDKIISQLKQMRAARNLSSTFSSSGGIGSVIGGVAGYSSPRSIAQNLSESMIKSQNKLVQKAAPASPTSKATAAAYANGLDMLNNLSPQAKQNLVNSKEGLKFFIDRILTSQEAVRETSKTLFGM